MDKSITRRAALGTAIAALAAGPFVMRVWRDGKTSSLPSEKPEVVISNKRNDFFSEWKSLRESLAGVQIVNDKTSENNIVLSRKFESPRKWKFSCLTTHAVGKVASFTECTPLNIGFYEIIDGTIKTASEDKPSLVIDVTTNEWRYLSHNTSMSKLLGLKTTISRGKDGSKTYKTQRDMPYNKESRALERELEQDNVHSYATGQFSVADNFHPLNPNELRSSSKNISGKPDLAQTWYAVCDLLQYPLLDNELSLGATYDYPAIMFTRQKYMVLGATASRMVSINNKRSVEFVPVFASCFDEYCKAYHARNWQNYEVEGGTSIISKDKFEDFLTKKSDELKKSINQSKPDLRYYVGIDSSMVIHNKTIVQDNSLLGALGSSEKLLYVEELS